jgi:hypothetical protein
MKTSPAKSDTRSRALAAGYRSGLEETLAETLTRLGVEFTYECHTLRYVVPEKPARYTPDFVLPNGIVVETKGRWVTADRQKIALVRKQHPDIDLRIVFSNPRAKITKVSKTSYADVCDKLGIQYAAKTVPAAWLNEPPNEASIAALAAFLKDTPK